ncbi:hypothetical protein CEP54_013138 [Fusarium duplospermum]|uniref:Uncharacterized protein n=1 Tax=Fusarium duplospermum TaxID=1325734 RepID=A0A428P4J8_9HYPO|nr:hypothetical protein CEP54_013138 [Fusarium duplospermum]
MLEILAHVFQETGIDTPPLSPTTEELVNIPPNTILVTQTIKTTSEPALADDGRQRICFVMAEQTEQDSSPKCRASVLDEWKRRHLVTSTFGITKPRNGP